MYFINIELILNFGWDSVEAVVTIRKKKLFIESAAAII